MPPHDPTAIAVGRAVGWGVAAAVIVVVAGVLATLGQPADRIPDDRLAAIARTLGWWVVTGLLAFLGLAVAVGRIPRGRPMPTAALVVCLTSIGGLLTCGGITLLLLLARVRWRYVTAAATAAARPAVS